MHSYWPAKMPSHLKSKQPIWDASVHSMKILAPYAYERDVQLNVEVLNRFEQFIINDSNEALKYVKEVNHPGCKILLDTFHMNIEEDSFSQAIKTIGKYLGAFHLGETNRKMPGTGRIPWLEIKEALDEIDYDGPLVMEPFLMKGGTVGADIGIWREMIEEPNLDLLAKEAATFVRKTLV